MATQDTCCTIVPYFEVPESFMETFKAECAKFVEMTRKEPGCLFYGFSFNGNIAHCREGYVDGDAALAHVNNVMEPLSELLKHVKVARLEIHGPEAELAKMREPLAPLSPEFFVLEHGFRK
jgi:quinol monooxygenase YgiN